MEIKEIISFYVNEVSETLEVSFRLFDDDDDKIREDQIELIEVETFGYNLGNKIDLDLFEEDDNYLETEFDLVEEFNNDDEIISFLNEYYLIYPNNLPESELF